MLRDLACDILPAQPAEMCLTARAGHVVASGSKFDRGLALGAPLVLSEV